MQPQRRADAQHAADRRRGAGAKRARLKIIQHRQGKRDAGRFEQIWRRLDPPRVIDALIAIYVSLVLGS